MSPFTKTNWKILIVLMLTHVVNIVTSALKKLISFQCSLKFGPNVTDVFVLENVNL